VDANASTQVARTSQRARYVAREAKPATNDPPGGACNAKDVQARGVEKTARAQVQPVGAGRAENAEAG
jgi:hypothetical protein